ncbi:periplasmic binding protein [Chloroherpeton thalassium ATCC 35110]|uniref:Periplasmic binding protein n=1 Tax=Chloroherpeton thalassium (strain ATCC 35110 / GB-78) TaxID=517418 RepID=B3QXE8_CHLT3|nr:ABC transporter substrate-binding protein [Chloroherpeton thalassium]ACF13422.1 periplasmic binding protein [Chloroherpeton thalassium ATCC 35110]
MTRYRKLFAPPIFAISFALLLLIFDGCGNEEKASLPNTREVTDMAGRKMVVPDTVRRVYVNRPGSVLMYAIAPELLVCRSLWTTDVSRKFMLEGYLQLPYVEGSAEEIIKLKPDVIISYFKVNPQAKDEADKLSEKTGIPVFMVEMDMQKYDETFELLGNLLNRKTQTDRMSAFMHTYLDSIRRIAPKIPADEKVRVYYAEGERGLNTDPSGSFHSEILEVVGAKNVADVAPLSGKGMSQVSMEQILMWKPDVVLVWTGMGATLATYEHIMNDAVWAKIHAVSEKKVYQIPYQPFGWFDRPPGTNRILGAIWTAQLLYPERYPFDMEAITREYFDIFYHHPLSQEALHEVLHPNPKGLELSKFDKK